jgi:hypothetical protein
MPDAAPASVLLQQYQRNMYKKKKNKNSFTKSSFLTLLLVSQRFTYDTKVEKNCYSTVFNFVQFSPSSFL